MEKSNVTPLVPKDGKKDNKTQIDDLNQDNQINSSKKLEESNNVKGSDT